MIERQTRKFKHRTARCSWSEKNTHTQRQFLWHNYGTIHLQLLLPEGIKRVWILRYRALRERPGRQPKGRRGSLSIAELDVVGWEEAVKTTTSAPPPTLVDELQVGDDFVRVKGDLVLIAGLVVVQSDCVLLGSATAGCGVLAGVRLVCCLLWLRRRRCFLATRVMLTKR